MPLMKWCKPEAKPQPLAGVRGGVACYAAEIKRTKGLYRIALNVL
jgi:hypothetical protein